MEPMEEHLQALPKEQIVLVLVGLVGSGKARPIPNFSVACHLPEACRPALAVDIRPGSRRTRPTVSQMQPR